MIGYFFKLMLNAGARGKVDLIIEVASSELLCKYLKLLLRLEPQNTHRTSS